MERLFEKPRIAEVARVVVTLSIALVAWQLDTFSFFALSGLLLGVVSLTFL